MLDFFFLNFGVCIVCILFGMALSIVSVVLTLASCPRGCGTSSPLQLKIVINTIMIIATVSLLMIA